MGTYFRQHSQIFTSDYLSSLQGQILACPYFTTNNLNADFVGTRGFSIVFHRSHQDQVEQRFPYFAPYLENALLPECNAFYLNPLMLQIGSQVHPHVDRSLRSYCKTITPPFVVSVLYITIPSDLVGGELVLSRGRKQVGQIRPQANTLVIFQGDLTHAVHPVTHGGDRLSLVCEQYCLDPEQLREIPEFRVESRALPRQVQESRQRGSRGKRSLVR